MNNRNRFAIVTPYCKEERGVLEQCLRSVQAQSLPADHFLVADGYPQDWLDNEPVRHIKLDRNHANNGNTPRGVGALLAVSEGYEGIGLLDADNWLEAHHVAYCDAVARSNPNCDYVIARRKFRRLDGSLLDAPDIALSAHVDTNCFFLLPGSFHVIPFFALMPNELSPICDRIFYAALKSRNLSAVVLTEKTVNYRTLWPSDYQRAGVPVPPEATRFIDGKWFADWMKAKSPRELEIIYRRCGMAGRLTITNDE